VTTPFEVPEIYNAPTLDGIAMRGLWKITSGAERITKLEQVQSPQYAGAFTIVRLEEMVNLEYKVEVITNDDYKWLQTMLQVFRQGQKLRAPKGPRTYKLEDPTIAHLEVRLVGLSKLTKLEHVGKGKHVTTIGFGEWKKKVPFGGPPAARPKTELEQKIEELNAENKALATQLATQQKIAAARK
jgi:hypothetical protein